MLKKIGLPMCAFLALLILVSPAPAKAGVSFGIQVGPAYPAYGYAYPASPYVDPYQGYYSAPYPNYYYSAPVPAYRYPAYGFGYRLDRSYRDNRFRGHEYREHNRNGQYRR